MCSLAVEKPRFVCVWNDCHVVMLCHFAILLFCRWNVVLCFFWNVSHFGHFVMLCRHVVILCHFAMWWWFFRVMYSVRDLLRLVDHHSINVTWKVVSDIALDAAKACAYVFSLWHHIPHESPHLCQCCQTVVLCRQSPPKQPYENGVCDFNVNHVSAPRLYLYPHSHKVPARPSASDRAPWH